MKIGRRTGANLTEFEAGNEDRYDLPFWRFRPIASGEARSNVHVA
jgi:hypothetical protein